MPMSSFCVAASRTHGGINLRLACPPQRGAHAILGFEPSLRQRGQARLTACAWREHECEHESARERREGTLPFEWAGACTDAGRAMHM